MDRITLISPKFASIPCSPIPNKLFPKFPAPIRRRIGCFASSLTDGDKVAEKPEMQSYTSIPSSADNEASIACQTPRFLEPYAASCIGSPLLWIGVGVGVSATFSVRKAIREAFKAVMDPTVPQNGKFNAEAFTPDSPFPFPAESASAPTAASEAHVESQPATMDDVPAAEIEANAPVESEQTESSEE
ncbi:protein TIC 40, chloroplastic-like isoform X3 [Ananas comosus]|uniref:Protein TIC 40, chloroplastic-like isoform X3 n=1 Tax=Ananas comosus TaxID=4615 RepID=A0A6P5FJW6_ANACO|nr:protein TIC 40, chloroplastic-like isoform X3 [Ananas comosus]